MREAVAERTFEDVYGVAAEVRADAPGRVNLIGEHTDYHDGFVLPCAIPQRTYVELRRRADTHVRAWSAEVTGAPIEYDLGAEARGRGWADYVQGLTWALGRAGFGFAGFDLRLRSEVPLGSGLSSSAALEVAVLRGLREAFSLPLDDVAIARFGQQAEVEFVGAPVGIMDQMASSLASGRDALFLDTRTLSFERLPLPAGVELVVIDSGIAHRHAGGEYVTRRRESEEAAHLLGVTRLRDAPHDALQRLPELPATIARRARHVITENARVLEAVAAIRRGDVARLGELFAESHASMRDDYEISTADIDALVRLGSEDTDIIGARLTGGGFGGAVVMLARAGLAAAAGERIVRRYQTETSRPGRVLVPRVK